MTPKTIPNALAQGYYLTNFTLLLDSVVGRYSDILTPGERAFVSGFAELSEEARRLYVRLVSRKGPLFRSDRLAYDDIPDINAAQAELGQRGYLEIGGEYDVAEALRLLRVGEIRELFEDVPGGLRKDDLLAWVAEEHDEQRIRTVIDEMFEVLSPAHSDTVSTYLLLFFGNAHQDLSEFVVTDLGHVRYEQYQLDPATMDYTPTRAIHRRASGGRGSRAMQGDSPNPPN